jgi:hypothetical protein
VRILALPVSIILVAGGLVGSINTDAIWTGVTLAVFTLVALAIVRVVGSWLLKSAREDFHDSIRQVVRTELQATGKNLAPVWEKMRTDVASTKSNVATIQSDLATMTTKVDEMKVDVDAIKAETAFGSGDSMKSSQARMEHEVGWLMAVSRKIADQVGIDLDELDP